LSILADVDLCSLSGRGVLSIMRSNGAKARLIVIGYSLSAEATFGVVRRESVAWSRTPDNE